MEQGSRRQEESQGTLEFESGAENAENPQQQQPLPTSNESLVAELQPPVRPGRDYTAPDFPPKKDPVPSAQAATFAEALKKVTLDNVEETLCDPSRGVDGTGDVIPLEVLFAKSNVTHAYRCAPIEQYFAVKVLPIAQRHGLTVLFLAGGLSFITSLLFNGDWTGWTITAAGVVMLPCAVANFVVTKLAKKKIAGEGPEDPEEGSRSDSTLMATLPHKGGHTKKVDQEGEASDPVPSLCQSTIKGRVLARDIRMVTVYEVLAVVLIALVSLLALVAYPQAIAHCRALWESNRGNTPTATDTPTPSSSGPSSSSASSQVIEEFNMSEYCVKQVYGFVIIPQIVPVLLLEVRLLVGAPPLLLSPALYLLGHKISQDNTPGDQQLDSDFDFALKQILHILLTGIFIATLFTQSRDRHKRFERWVLLQRSTALMRKQRAEVDKTLCNLIPPSLIAKLDAGLAPFDASEMCTLGVTQIFDYVHWSASIMPFQIVELVDILFVTFDRHVSNRFQLVKVKTVGDRYLTCSGMMEELKTKESSLGHVDAESNPQANSIPERNKINAQAAVTDPTERQAVSTRRVLLFTVWAHAFCDHLCSSLGQEKFKLKSGIHVGPCCGGIIGNRTLWCDIVGEAFDVAQLLASRAPEGAVTLSSAAVEAINGASVESEPILVARDEFGTTVYDGGSSPSSSGKPTPCFFRFSFLTRTSKQQSSTVLRPLVTPSLHSTVEQYLFVGVRKDKGSAPRPAHLLGTATDQFGGSGDGSNNRSQASTRSESPRPAGGQVSFSGVVFQLDTTTQQRGQMKQRADDEAAKDREIQSMRHRMLRKRVQASLTWDASSAVQTTIAEASTGQDSSQGNSASELVKEATGQMNWGAGVDFFGFDEALVVEADLDAPLHQEAFCQRHFFLAYPNELLEAQFVRFLRATKSDPTILVAMVALQCILVIIRFLEAGRPSGQPLFWVQRVLTCLLIAWVAIKLRLQYVDWKRSQEEAAAMANGTPPPPREPKPSPGRQNLLRRLDLGATFFWYLMPIPLLGLGEPSILTGSFLYLQIALQMLCSFHLKQESAYLRVVLIMLIYLETAVFSCYIAYDQRDGHPREIDIQAHNSFLILSLFIAYNSFSLEKRSRQWFHDTALSSAFHEAAETELLLVKGMLNMLIPEALIPFALAKIGNTGDGIVSSLGEVCVVQIRLENTSRITAHLAGGQPTGTSPSGLVGRGAIAGGGTGGGVRGVLKAMEFIESLYGAVESSLEKANRLYETMQQRSKKNGEKKKTPLLEKISTVGDEVLIAGPVQEQPAIKLSDITNVAVMNKASKVSSTRGGEYKRKPPNQEEADAGQTDGSKKQESQANRLESLQQDWMHCPDIRASLARDSTLRAGIAMVDMLGFLREALISSSDTMVDANSHGRSLELFSAALHVESAFASFLGTKQPSFTLLGPSVRAVEAVLSAAAANSLCMTGAFRRMLHNGKMDFPRHDCDFSIAGETDRWGLRGVGLLQVFTLQPPVSVLVEVEEEEQIPSDEKAESNALEDMFVVL